MLYVGPSELRVVFGGMDIGLSNERGTDEDWETWGSHVEWIVSLSFVRPEGALKLCTSFTCHFSLDPGTSVDTLIMLAVSFGRRLVLSWEDVQLDVPEAPGLLVSLLSSRVGLFDPQTALELFFLLILLGKCWTNHTLTFFSYSKTPTFWYIKWIKGWIFRWFSHTSCPG